MSISVFSCSGSSSGSKIEAVSVRGSKRYAGEAGVCPGAPGREYAEEVPPGEVSFKEPSA